MRNSKEIQKLGGTLLATNIFTFAITFIKKIKSGLQLRLVYDYITEETVDLGKSDYTLFDMWNVDMNGNTKNFLHTIFYAIQKNKGKLTDAIMKDASKNTANLDAKEISKLKTFGQVYSWLKTQKNFDAILTMVNHYYRHLLSSIIETLAVNTGGQFKDGDYITLNIENSVIFARVLQTTDNAPIIAISDGQFFEVYQTDKPAIVTDLEKDLISILDKRYTETVEELTAKRLSSLERVIKRKESADKKAKKKEATVSRRKGIAERKAKTAELMKVELKNETDINNLIADLKISKLTLTQQKAINSKINKAKSALNQANENKKAKATDKKAVTKKATSKEATEKEATEVGFKLGSNKFETKTTAKATTSKATAKTSRRKKATTKA